MGDNLRMEDAAASDGEVLPDEYDVDEDVEESGFSAEDDDDDEVDNKSEGSDNMVFDDFTFINRAETPTDDDVVVLSRDFSTNNILEKALPNTWMYRQILHSTPMLASSVLTQYLKIKSVSAVYIAPDDIVASSFYLKKK